MSGINVKKERRNELGILCYKVPALPVNWYSVHLNWYLKLDLNLL